jgi:hypothetical protein
MLNISNLSGLALSAKVASLKRASRSAIELGSIAFGTERLGLPAAGLL